MRMVGRRELPLSTSPGATAGLPSSGTRGRTGEVLRSTLVLLSLALLVGTHSLADHALAQELTTITIASSADGTLQPALWYGASDAPAATPLLVMLHTWSGGYDQRTHIEQALPLVAELDWAVIQPHARGPNRTPAACASELAVQDVLDAIDEACRQRPIDRRRIYLLGASGGGHLALVMAGRHPERFTAVSAWVPITDLAAWYEENTSDQRSTYRGYAENVAAVCGGPPGASEQVDAEYRRRSPVTWLAAAQGLPLEIQHGIRDGHEGSVAITHSLHAFNLLATANGQPSQAFTDAEIKRLAAEPRVPDDLQTSSSSEFDGPFTPLLERHAGPVRAVLFDGGHEVDVPAAISWLAQHEAHDEPRAARATFQGRDAASWREDLGSDEAATRHEAVKALGALHDSQGLLAALDHPDPVVRYWAAIELGRAGDTAWEIITRLKAAAQDEAPYVRVAAGEALCRLDQLDAGLAALTAGLKHPLEKVRLAAASSLEALGPKARSALPAIKHATDDSNQYVVRIAQALLAQLAGDEQ